MRVKIEIEVTPKEMPVATELIQALKSLAAQVEAKVKYVPDAQTNLQRFTAMIRSVEDDDGKDLEEVAVRIQRSFEDHGDEQLLWDFFEAFSAVVLEGDLVRKEKPVAPFVYLLSRIPEPFKTRARDALIQKILKFLTIKRPADCVRAEFFAHAEAFAALVKLEFVSIKGAITTINTLLKKDDNRCAALTMLGKTVELCLDILTEKCEKGVLRELQMTLESITDPAFEYDIAYIRENMSWQDGGGGGGDHPWKPIPLVPHRCFEGHRNVIFSLAYDPVRDVLVSASKDGRVITWGSDGKQQDLIELPRHYACSMDINPRQRILYMCGVSKETQGIPSKDVSPAVIAFVQTDHGKWQQHGILEKQDTKVISSIKAGLGAGHQFVTGETMKDSVNEYTRSVVCCYDLHGNPSFETLRPVAVFAEHQDIITCMAAVPRSEHTFLSGSRDCRVLLWDVRVPKSVGVLLGHDGTVTSVSASDHLVVTGGLDKKLMTFDIRLLTPTAPQLRPLSTLMLDESAVLKVALGHPTEAAASTLLGLYQINLVTNESRQVQGFLDPTNPNAAKTTRYHDLVWSRDHAVLYAAGDDMRIDVYVKGGLDGGLR